MVAPNQLLLSPPYEVEQALKRLGQHLRIARVRRRLTRPEVAGKIGTGIRAITDAEKGKPSTSIAVYVALLWAYGLLEDFQSIADPTRDLQGLTLELARTGVRARRRDGRDRDF